MGIHLRRHARFIWPLLGLLLLLYAGLWVYSLAMVELGPFAVLGALLLLGLLGVTLLPILLVQYRRSLRATVIPVAGRLWTLIAATGLVRRIGARFPRLSGFVAARLALGAATGLGLTVGLAVALAAIWVFGLLLVEVATGDDIVTIDRRIINLAAMVRTPALDRFMLAVTFLGNVRTVLALGMTAVLIALLLRRRDAAIVILLSLGTSSLFFGSIKWLVGRPRPLLESARIVQAGWSFPSGHATVSAAFYGTLAYLLLRPARRGTLRVLLALCAALLALLIGVSRVYLGVHYPSDVLAGWTLGALWLILIVILEYLRPPRPPGNLSTRRRVLAVVLAVGLLLFATPYVYNAYRQTPPPLPTTARAPAQVIAASDLPSAVAALAPRYSETLFGDPVAPLGPIFVGTRAELEGALRAAGWSLPDSAGGKGLLPVEPAPPAFIDARPNILAFAHPPDTGGMRGILRVWSTPLQTGAGQRVWLATTSYDQGLRLVPPTFLPDDRIVPSPDTAPMMVVAALEATGAVARTEPLQLGPPPDAPEDEVDEPLAGTGEATLIWLRRPPPDY